MVAEKAQELVRRLKALHEALASEGPTDRTGRVLQAVAEICDPAWKFAAMWKVAVTPFDRRQAAMAAISEVLEYLS